MADIYSDKRIALRCSLCGRLEHHTLSVFSFSGTRVRRIQCSCGFRTAVVSIKTPHLISIQIPCILCGSEHLFTYSAKELWGAELERFVCPESGTELGFFGSEDAVLAAAEDWSQRHAGAFDDYFRNPPVMFDMLNHLHNVAEERQLYCHCGSQEIEVDLYPDYLELQCMHCGDVSHIPALTTQDRDTLAAMVTVILHDGTISSQGNPVAPNLYRLK